MFNYRGSLRPSLSIRPPWTTESALGSTMIAAAGFGAKHDTRGFPDFACTRKAASKAALIQDAPSLRLVFAPGFVKIGLLFRDDARSPARSLFPTSAPIDLK